MRGRKQPMIHLTGFNGMGKSSLAGTITDRPMLSLDFEGRNMLTRGKTTVTFEDYLDGAVVAAKDGMVVKQIDSYEDWHEGLRWILDQDNASEFGGVVVDSLQLLQEKITWSIWGIDADEDDPMDWDPNPKNKDGRVDWRRALFIAIHDLRLLNRLTHPGRDNPMPVVCITPTNRDDSQPRRPHVSGALAQRCIGIFDMQAACVKQKTDDGYSFDLVIDLVDYFTDDYEVKCNIPEVSEKFGHLIEDPHLGRDVVQLINQSVKGAK